MGSDVFDADFFEQASHDHGWVSLSDDFVFDGGIVLVDYIDTFDKNGLE